MAAHGAQIGTWRWSQAVQALVTVGTHPAIQRAARVRVAAAVWMVVSLGSQLAHQLATFGGRQSRIGGGSHDAVAEQGDGFARVGTHTDLLQGDGAIQPAPSRHVAGGLLLVPSAWPPLIRLQNRHRPAMRSPKRRRARCQAAPSACTATVSSSPSRSTAAGSRCTANATMAAVKTGARRRKRRRQSRAVVIGTPTWSATLRIPKPITTLSTSARPI